MVVLSISVLLILWRPAMSILPPSLTLCFLGPSKPIWSSKTHLCGLHTFCCSAVHLLEIAKDHIRAFTPSPHRRWVFNPWWSIRATMVGAFQRCGHQSPPQHISWYEGSHLPLARTLQLKIIEYGMVWVKRDFKNYLVLTPNLVQPAVKQSHFPHCFNNIQGFFSLNNSFMCHFEMLKWLSSHCGQFKTLTWDN